MEEEWRDVVGFEGWYQVSNIGNVRSLDRELKGGVLGSELGQTFKYIRNGKLISKSIDKGGYEFSRLHKNGVSKNIVIHRLVAIAFIPNPENKREVNHLNGIKGDNRVENLAWCTRSENILHAYASGLFDRIALGKSIAKLSEGDVLSIMELIKNGEKGKDIAIKFNVTPANISDIKNGKTWSHTTGIKYEKKTTL